MERLTMIAAEKTVIKTRNHSWSAVSSVLVLLILLIVALEYETASSAISLIVVWTCSLSSEEEDANRGDNVWDDTPALIWDDMMVIDV